MKIPQHRRPNKHVQAVTMEWHRDKARQWLEVLDRHIIGPRHGFVCGDGISIADYLGAPMVALGDVARIDYSPYPNVRRWLANMKALASWNGVFAAIDGYAAQIATSAFEPLHVMELEAG